MLAPAIEETAEAEIFTLSETLFKELDKHAVELVRSTDVGIQLG